MNGPALLGLLETDRGGLSSAAGDSAPRLERHVDLRFADRSFRRKVEALASVVEQWKPPRVLPICGHEQLGDHYFIHYELPAASVESLPECFGHTHWLERLSFVRQLLWAGERIREHIPAPLGLHAGTIVACRIGNGWEAFLALCPVLDHAGPDDVMHAHPWVLSGLPPERLRGNPDIAAQEDLFAAGVLVLLALGARPAVDLPAEEALEAQARAVLLGPPFQCPDVEPALRKIPYIAARLEELQRCACRCIHFSTDARPRSLEELEQACDQVLVFSNAQAFAAEVEAKGNAGDALRFLEWAAATGQDGPAVRRMAAQFCETMGHPGRELQHLEKYLAFRPWDKPARRRRWKLRYEGYLNRPPRDREATDLEGDWLLGELNELRPPGMEDLDPEERVQAKEDCLNAALIYSQRSDLFGKARELYQATKLDFKDIEALLLYGLSCREIAMKEDLGPESRQEAQEKVRKLLRVVEDRVSRLEVAGFLDRESVKTWIERFTSLLLY